MLHSTEEQFELEFADAMREKHSDLPYHNFEGHVLSAVDYFEDIVDDLESKGVVINRHFGRLALYGHDAGFEEDHDMHGLSTKEEYASEIRKAKLAEMGMADSSITTISSAILATHYQAEPETNLEKAVRLADIGNVSADEREFLRNMGLLIQESIVLRTPLTDTFAEHCQRTQSFLQAYLNPAPAFTAESGEVVQLDRHMSFVNNIARLSALSLAKLVNVSEKFTIPQKWSQPTLSED